MVLPGESESVPTSQVGSQPSESGNRYQLPDNDPELVAGLFSAGDMEYEEIEDEDPVPYVRPPDLPPLPGQNDPVNAGGAQSDVALGASGVAEMSTQESREGKMLEILDRMSKVSAQLAGTSAPKRSALRVSDLKLKEFSGHPDQSAQHIRTDKFLSLLRWMQDCKARLSAYDFAEKDKVTVLVSALAGGARAVFNAKYGDEAVHEWSLDQAFHKLAALVPQHGVLFTRKAFDMRFKATTLVEDIKTYELYMRYGDLNPDGSQFVWTDLQNKITSACPTLFAVAANEQNLFFQWSAEKPFHEHVHDALKIVSVLQTMEKVIAREEPFTAGAREQSKGKKRRGADEVGTSGTALGEKSAKAAKKADKSAQQSRKEANTALARKHFLCFKCSKHVHGVGAMKQHKETCKGDAAVFAQNMKVVAKLDAEGKVDEIKSRTPLLPEGTQK